MTVLKAIVRPMSRWRLLSINDLIVWQVKVRQMNHRRGDSKFCQWMIAAVWLQKCCDSVTLEHDRTRSCDRMERRMMVKMKYTMSVQS